MRMHVPVVRLIKYIHNVMIILKSYFSHTCTCELISKITYSAKLLPIIQLYMDSIVHICRYRNRYKIFQLKHP